MGQRNVRVVVGQGDPDRQGFLRTVLEDVGFDVVGEAATASPLARLLTDERPDVVVLDDAIGVSAVQLTAEIVPSAKIVVVWPAAVMPIAGAMRVDPSEVLHSLAATVGFAAGLGMPGIERPEWIEKVRKDPATLRELLAARGGVPTRPSVTELQRRGHRLHPSPGSPRRSARAKPKATGKPSEEERRAIVTPLPLAAAAASKEESWNRRLGIIALGGAAVAGALLIALAFSNRAPSFTAAEPFIPPIVQPTQVPPPPDGGNGSGQTPGGDHNPTGGGGTNGGPSGDPAGGTTGGTSGSGTDVRGGLGGPVIPQSGGGGGGGGRTPEGNPGGPRTGDHLPGSHGDGNDGGSSTTSQPPGNSGSHNPHGGPPEWEHRPDHTDHASNAGGQSGAHAGGQSSNAGGNSSHAGGRSALHAHKQ